MANNNNDDYAGYSLFTDVEDKELQVYNRARTMVNIMEDHSVGKNVSGRGAMICAGYFNKLPAEDREAVHSKTAAILLEKGLTK